MNLPLAHSLALSLHSTHPLSCRFLAVLNESFPTRCGRSCGMPFLLENRPKTVKKISRGAAPDPLSLPISGRAPRQSGPLAEAQSAGLSAFCVYPFGEAWRPVGPHLLTADSDLLEAARNLLDQKSGGVHLQAVGASRLRSRHA